jgi:hypothetical protein
MSDVSKSEQKKEDWMNAKWRPMMGWMYMLVCTMDFVLFPILWSVINAVHSGSVGQQWNPITLQGAGLFHMAMGAVIGVAAFGRTQEKLAGANVGGAPAASPFPAAPVPAPAASPFPAAAPAASPFPSAPAASPFPAAPAPVFVSSSGKPGPAPQVDPLI